MAYLFFKDSVRYLWKKGSEIGLIGFTDFWITGLDINRNKI
jgi:hypothetical protein